VRKKLIAQPRAEFDLIRQYLYFAERNPPQAERFWKAVHAAMKSIAVKPARGTALAHPSFPNQELRFVRPTGFSNHFLIYQVTDDSALLLRILHSSQNVDTELRPE
jgi:plasmid stabilization system protein ParE